jgi:formylglycine-generating enzyme required for sulfatase activity
VIHKLLSAVIFSVAFGNTFGQPSAGVSALDWAKKKCTDIGFKAGTERFGNCVLQLSRNDEAVGVVNPKPVLVTPTQLPKPESQKELTTFKDCDECPEMVVIPAGKFLMGSKDDPFANPKPDKVEMPQHEVSVKSFSIGKFEITQEQWYSVMGTMPSKFKGRTLPVEQISWNDAQEFVKKLSEKTGKLYRLPSEAEWEFAARSGSQTTYFFGNAPSAVLSFAWNKSNSSNTTRPVGEKYSNLHSLYDVYGNVWEWTQDCWNDNYVGAPLDGSAWITGDCSGRVLRGGSWADHSQYMTSTFRYRGTANLKSDERGLRVARDN